MIKWLVRLSESVIFWLFTLLFSLTYVFAWLSPNLTLGDNDVFGTSTSVWLLGIFFCVILLSLSFIFLPKSWQGLRQFYCRQQNLILSVFCLVVLSLQLLFVFFFHPAMGWDVAALHQGVLTPNAPAIQSYYSLNINNLPIVWAMTKLSQLFGTQSWFFFDLVTLVLVDLAALWTTLTVAIVKRRAVPYAIVLQGCCLVVFPWIVVPYTDAWVLPLVSGYLLAYTYLVYRAKHWSQIVIWSGMLALFVAMTYFMKPSSVIPFIAIVIHTLLGGVVRLKTIDRQKWLAIATTLMVLGASVMLGKQLLHQQTLIAVDEKRAIPAIHFINMGISNEGGYNPNDALMMEKLPTKAEKTAYSWRSYKERLRERGVMGYAQFLVTKQGNNTADGTFAWLKEGTFFVQDKPTHTGLSGFIEDSFYLYGERIADYRYLAQIMWLVLLTPILFAYRDRKRYTMLLRLSLLGAFVFLLVFEGGRSRYMIQFLPVVLLFSILEAERTKRQLIRIWHAIYYSPEERMRIR